MTNSELKRDLGLPEALSIVVGRIIGSGIFRTPGPMMALVMSVPLFYSTWLIGGVATIMGAILVAEMAAMIPRSGGPYAYLMLAYPPIWTFLRGWAMFFVSETASIVAVALVFSQYGRELLRLTLGIELPTGSAGWIALGLVWLLTLSNLFGVLLSGRLQNLLSFIKVFSLFIVIIASFSTGGSLGNFTLDVPGGDWLSRTIAIFAALRYGFFAYSGWEGATYVAEEIKQPGKNLPLSLLLGIISVMALYLLVNSAYLYKLSIPEFVLAGKSIASNTMTLSLGLFGGILISLIIMFSTAGNVSTQILVKSRTWYAMARDGLFFHWLSELHPVYNTPNRSLIFQGIWATVLLLFASQSENAYEKIIDFFSFTSAIFNLSTFFAVYRLRKKFPDKERPYRAFMFPVIFPLVIVIHLTFAAVTLYDAFIPSMLGVVLTLTGLLYYYGTGKHRMERRAIL